MSSATVRVGATGKKHLTDEAERLGVADTYVADAAVTQLMKLPQRDRDRLIREAAKQRRQRRESQPVPA